MTTSQYNDFPLNASGLTNITFTGVSKFGLRELTYDIGDVEPTNVIHSVKANFADVTGTATDPKLVVEHAAAAAPAEEVQKQSIIWFNSDE
jgi:hypothetical protein